MTAMRIGILGGSFDPVHYGHLVLAREAAEQSELDLVLFIPANLSPHKTGTNPATAEDRMQMVQLAIEGEKGFAASGIELQRPAPSYTVDTLQELKNTHPQDELVLLIGSDQAAKFDTWHKPDEIRRLARIVVLRRAGGSSGHQWPVVGKLVDISSSDIRARVAAEKSIHRLTPDSVCDYIRTHRLYRHA